MSNQPQGEIRIDVDANASDMNKIALMIDTRKLSSTTMMILRICWSPSRKTGRMRM